MAIEKVREYFSKFGISDRIQEFDVSSATVELAAQALGCEPCRIAKTLSFLADGHAVLVVAAGDAKIDNPKYKAQFGTTARRLNESLKRFPTVFPACGRSSSAIELTIDELEKYSGSSSWIDVCKNWQT